jgi:hypothetical protein
MLRVAGRPQPSQVLSGIEGMYLTPRDNMSLGRLLCARSAWLKSVRICAVIGVAIPPRPESNCAAPFRRRITNTIRTQDSTTSAGKELARTPGGGGLGCEFFARVRPLPTLPQWVPCAPRLNLKPACGPRPSEPVIRHTSSGSSPRSRLTRQTVRPTGDERFSFAPEL